jgi:hypothetical protein
MATAYYELGDVLFAGVAGFLLALTLVFLPSLVTLLNCSTVVLAKRPAEKAPSPPPSRHAACATLLHRELFRLPVQVFVFAARAAEHFRWFVLALPALFYHVMSRARGFFYAAITSLSPLCVSKRRVFTPRHHDTHVNLCKLAHFVRPPGILLYVCSSLFASFKPRPSHDARDVSYSTGSQELDIKRLKKKNKNKADKARKEARFVRSLGILNLCSSLFASFKPRPSHDARDVSNLMGSPQELDIKRLKKKNKNKADKARKKARRLAALGNTALKSSICDSDGDSLTSPYAIKR